MNMTCVGTPINLKNHKGNRFHEAVDRLAKLGALGYFAGSGRFVNVKHGPEKVFFVWFIGYFSCLALVP